MRNLIARDDGQLHRLEAAIAAFNARPEVERNRHPALLAAMEVERSALVHAYARPARRPA